MGVCVWAGGLALLAGTIAENTTAGCSHAVRQCSGGRNIYADETVRSSLMLVQLKEEDFAVSDVSGRPGTPISLSIRSADGRPDGDLFAITGLPQEVKLSAGGPANAMWIVTRKDLRSLSLLAPKGFSGAFPISVTRVQTPSRGAQTLVMTVKISNEAAASLDNDVTAMGLSRRQALPHVQTPDEKLLFDRASSQLQKGDVAGARAIFEYLVTKGDPAAALALGESYDPLILSRIFVKGVEANEAKALAWYLKARRLGSPQADARLEALGSK